MEKIGLTEMAIKKGVRECTLRRKAWRAGYKAPIAISDEEFEEIWKIPSSSLEEINKSKNKQKSY